VTAPVGQSASGRARAELRAALRANASDLLAYFERRTPIRDDAADLLAETMLQAWRRVDALVVGQPVRQRMWLFTIASNVLANHRRAVGRRAALADRLRNRLVNTGAESVDGDLAARVAVRDAVERLPQSHRELVMLVHWDGMSIAEAAEVLGLNPSTARGRYAEVRATLREALTEDACS
jgi:RNA polymerase sigma-70 factor (ECF subfamily)